MQRMTSTSQRGMRLTVQLLDGLDQPVYGKALHCLQNTRKICHAGLAGARLKALRTVLKADARVYVNMLSACIVRVHN